MHGNQLKVRLYNMKLRKVSKLTNLIMEYCMGFREDQGRSNEWIHRKGEAVKGGSLA